MIYIKCGEGMHGATVLALDAADAVRTAEILANIGVQVAAYANEEGEALTGFVLRLMATDRAILSDALTSAS